SFRARVEWPTVNTMSLTFEPAIAANQGVGRAVVRELGLRGAFKLGGGFLRQDFSQLDAPLVERIDVPDRPLGEDAVLVERDQGAQRFGGQPLGENRVARTIALEHAVRRERGRRALRQHFLFRLAEGERLTLRK